jgi:serine/threonine-protein kinase
MKPARVCDQCHGELPGDAPEELCPKCLLKLGGAELGILVRRQEAGAEVHGSEAAGRKFGNYEVLEKIAQGGMGAVYKARQLNLDRLVALKLLPFGQFSRDDLLQRFRSEASAAAALQHPNIVAVHDVGEHEGQPFFSMDFVEGRTLAELVRDQPLPAKRAAAYLKTIAEAVHYAHQHGILHRDLKPSNILIDSSDQPRITDFGLAKRLGDSALCTPHSPITLTGQVLGSPNFMSPEQADGRSHSIGPPSDVYSLGALLYHLLTRQPPFQADTLTTLLKQVLEAEPVPPRSLNPSIPKDLETICLKCLEKEPHRRYATAQALADDLDRFLNHEPVLARPIGPSGKAWRWCRRQPVRASLIGALALVLVLGMVGISWQWRRAEREGEMNLRQAYAGDMKIAQIAVEEGNLGGARRLLDRYRPRLSSPSTLNPQLSTDLRGWEWRYLWGLCRSDEQCKLTQQSKGFVNLAFSPDGKLLVLRQDSGNIELWDWEVRRHVGTLTNQGWQLAMAFSPDGKLIASANRDGSDKPVVSFWDVAT